MFYVSFALSWTRAPAQATILEVRFTISELIIPYAMSDHATCFATVPVNEVLAAMRGEKA